MQNISVVQEIQNLKNNDISIRRKAAWNLGQVPDKRSVEPLINALRNDPDRFVRNNSVKALAKIGDPRSISVLKYAKQKDVDDKVKEEAAYAIEKIQEANSKTKQPRVKVSRTVQKVRKPVDPLRNKGTRPMTKQKPKLTSSSTPKRIPQMKKPTKTIQPSVSKPTSKPTIKSNQIKRPIQSVKPTSSVKKMPEKRVIPKLPEKRVTPIKPTYTSKSVSNIPTKSKPIIRKANDTSSLKPKPVIKSQPKQQPKQVTTKSSSIPRPVPVKKKKK